MFGIDIKESDIMKNYLRDAVVSLAGPAANIILSFFGMPLSLALGFFHLLPIVSMDGGNALFSLLCIFFKRDTAFNVVYIISFIILLPLTILGFMFLLDTRNFSLLFLCVYLMLTLVFKKENYL
jgi:stage IV sporulation protein FB